MELRIEVIYKLFADSEWDYAEYHVGIDVAENLNDYVERYFNSLVESGRYSAIRISNVEVSFKKAFTYNERR